eukprot:TRINITY_DN954_c0_g1_i1.p1 TRINITY_DN954_c0_g1~~TRINITY_DN954_c0_g1_i1.p1  ORF type:complete len:638 (-),score=97.50 TRINITY_DN954_c0_g1_i1:9399-11312(-)
MPSAHPLRNLVEATTLDDTCCFHLVPLMNVPAFSAPAPLPSWNGARPRVTCPPSISSLSARRSRRASSESEPTPPRRRARRPTISQSDYNRAIQLSTRRDKRAARALYRTLATKHPRDARVWLGWAQLESRARNFDAARAVFEEAVTFHAMNVRLLHAWAVMEDRCGRAHSARQLFKRCLDIDVTDGVVWQSWALLEERCSYTDDARRLFERGVTHAPDNHFLWSAWGVLEQRHGRYKRACSLFEKAIQLDPTHVRTYQAYAITKEKMEKYTEARQLFTHALRVNPRSVPTYQAYALFAARRGSLDLARELFEKGAQIDPLHAPIWHAWAVMEQKEGRYNVARELFQKGVNAAPGNTPMLRAWASMELELGHIDKSADWIVPRAKFVHQQKNKRTSQKDKQKQITAVGENLKMLRLMIGRRSDEDMNTVMKWLDIRAKADRQIYDALQKRKDDDVRKVSEWVARRSASDISSFKEWLADRYERDRRIGVYVFNWDIPPSRPAPAYVPVIEKAVQPEKPIEWYKLSEESIVAMNAASDQLYYSDKARDHAEGMYFMGQIAEGLVDRAALLFILGVMSLALIGTSANLFGKGYSPSGAVTQREENVDMPPPSGVDAHLYEKDGAEAVVRRSLQKMQSGK